MPPSTHPSNLSGPPEPAVRTTRRAVRSRPIRRRNRTAAAAVAVSAVVASFVVSGPPRAEAQVPTGEPCAPGVGVTVVVDNTALGGVQIGCAAGAQASGFSALQAAGFVVGNEAGPGSVCTIGGLPSQGYPYCWSTGGYWSYWKKSRGGTWGFSGSGPAGGPIPIDSVEGWSWAQGFSSAAPRADETSVPTTTTTTTPTTTTPTTSAPTTSAPTASTPGPSTTSAPAEPGPGPSSTSTGTVDPGSSSTTSAVGSPGPSGAPPAAGATAPPTTGRTASAGLVAGRPRQPLARTGAGVEPALLAASVLLLAGTSAAMAARRLAPPGP